jgi:ATP-dependent DNA helicase RecG
MIRYILKELVPLMRKLPEYLPEPVVRDHRLTSLAAAYEQTHFPSDEQSLAAARRRLQFDELLLIHLHVLQNRRSLDTARATALTTGAELLEKMKKMLPYELTAPQEKSLAEIIADLGKMRPMNRLLEGDVGSGKTVVAALASQYAIAAGSQVAFMAPTEVLALQHYKTLYAQGAA